MLTTRSRIWIFLHCYQLSVQFSKVRHIDGLINQMPEEVDTVLEKEQKKTIAIQELQYYAELHSVPKPANLALAGAPR